MKSILLALTYAVGNLGVLAQNDTIHWFAAPDVSNGLGQSPVYLRLISNDNPANITVSLPANGSFVDINTSLNAFEVDSINLTPFLADIESPGANVVGSNGIRISSDEAINVQYQVKSGSSRTNFSLKGTKALGTDFYAPFHKFYSTGSTTPSSFSSFEIVATENATTVLITPRTAIVGHGKDSTFSVTLNEGETYSARDIDPSGVSSLAGSIIASNKPVAVTIFEGAINNGSCNSPAGDQITTSEYIGTDYIAHKGAGNGDRLVILATQNGTSVDVANSGSNSTLINWGETFEVDLSDPITYISCSKPVYAIQFSGFDCQLDMSQIPSLFCAGEYDSYFTRNDVDSIGLMLYTRSGFEGSFTLNGNPSLIQASDFNVVPGTNSGFVSAVKYFDVADISVHSHNIVSNSGDIFGMAILEGSNASGAGLSYVSEFTATPFVLAGNDTTICENTTLDLNGFVGGGSVTGYWSGTGFGAFDSGSTALTNVYEPSPLDTIVSPIELILTSSGPCPVVRDTIVLNVSAAPIVNASADQVVCGNVGIVQLNGTVEGGATSGVWSTNGSGTFSPSANDLNAIYTMTSSDTASGNLEFVLTSAGPSSCGIERDTMEVTITDSPFSIIVQDTIYVCNNNANFSLSGAIQNGAGTGKWSTSGSGLFTPSNLDLNPTYNPSPNDLNAGEIVIELQTTNNGGCLPHSDSVRVIFTNAPTVDAGNNLIACTNEASFQLSGSVNGPTTTGTWSGGAGTFSPSSNDLNAVYTPTASEIASGFVNLTLTSTNNQTCVANSDPVNLDFVAPPSANFSVQNVCFGEESEFIDFSLPGFGSITSWNWDFDNSSSSNNQNENILYSSPGSYDVQLIVENSGTCSDTIIKTVEVYEIPVASFDHSINCDGSQLIVDFTDQSTTNQDAITNWLYDFGGQGIQSVQDPSQLFIGDGNFVITQIVTTVNNCVDTNIQIINIDPRPEAGFFYNTSNGLNIGATFEFIDSSNNAQSYYWTFGDGDDSFVQDPDHIYFENGSYIVTQLITGSYGCEDSVSQVININTVTDEISTLIPNAISPNGDGRNDAWKLDFLDLLYPDAIVEIFNRWGQLMYRTEGIYYPWPGTFEGEPVADGTYFYVIDLKDGTEPIKGNILVLRKK